MFLPTKMSQVFQSDKAEFTGYVIVHGRHPLETVDDRPILTNVCCDVKYGQRNPQQDRLDETAFATYFPDTTQPLKLRLQFDFFVSDAGDKLLHDDGNCPNPYLFRIEWVIYLFAFRLFDVRFDAAVLFLARLIDDRFGAGAFEFRVVGHRFPCDKPPRRGEDAYRFPGRVGSRIEGAGIAVNRLSWFTTYETVRAPHSRWIFPSGTKAGRRHLPAPLDRGRSRKEGRRIPLFSPPPFRGEVGRGVPRRHDAPYLGAARSMASSRRFSGLLRG